MTDLMGDTETWIPSLTDFGERLALVRWRMRWNMKEAALACGIPAQNWRIWELDGSLPRDLVSVAERISERSGVDLDWLLRGPRRTVSADVVRRPLAGRRRITEEYLSGARRPPAGRPAGTPGGIPTPRRTARVAA